MEERAKAFANILSNKEKKFQGHKIVLEKDLKSFCVCSTTLHLVTETFS